MGEGHERGGLSLILSRQKPDRIVSGRPKLDETRLTHSQYAIGVYWNVTNACGAECTPLDAPMETWPSGRRRSPAKGVWVKSPSRVRIPSSPPLAFGANRPIHITQDLCLSFGGLARSSG